MPRHPPDALEFARDLPFHAQGPADAILKTEKSPSEPAQERNSCSASLIDTLLPGYLSRTPRRKPALQLGPPWKVRNPRPCIERGGSRPPDGTSFNRYAPGPACRHTRDNTSHPVRSTEAKTSSPCPSAPPTAAPEDADAIGKIRFLNSLEISTETREKRPGSPPRTPFPDRGMVEPDGIEPTTSCLQSRRSPN